MRYFIKKCKFLYSLFKGINFVLLVLFITACNSNVIWVDNTADINTVIKNAVPGNIICLKEGVYSDIEINFKAKGTPEKKIILKAEKPGKVTISGKSNLSISGEYLEVSGLVFCNGESPTSEVISFRTASDEIASNCRVTNCLINHFSKKERYESDIWIAMYGKANRFDHNTILGKNNKGVTLAVRLNTEESRENHHKIDHNYFGGRPVLGSNGGETIRIGTSHYSLSNSFTEVSDNYFEKCNGEVEIVSVKSSGNKILNNVFYECQGTLTLRHGNDNIVQNNYFLGNNIANTGGIRIINENQQVHHNYLYEIAGLRFWGALVIMNGVPDSPLNRYNQVKNSKIEKNIFVNCSNFELCAGSDSERSATPLNTLFANNIIYSDSNKTNFNIYDDISGIEFKDNIINIETQISSSIHFDKIKFSVTKNNTDLILPSEEILEKYGFKDFSLPVNREEAGAEYYWSEDRNNNLTSDNTIEVSCGQNTLYDAIQKAKPGDKILLKESGVYNISKEIIINFPITILSLTEKEAILKPQVPNLFRIENGGALKLKNIEINGSDAPDQPGNSIISSSRYSMNTNFKIVVDNCNIKKLDINNSYNFISIAKGVFADSVVITNSVIDTVSGSIISADKEVDDLGMYNIENVLIEDSFFSDILGPLLNIYRGGTDESTSGPAVIIQNCNLLSVGNGKKNKTRSCIKMLGVQSGKISKCKFDSCRPVDITLTNGEPRISVTDCVFSNTDKIITNSDKVYLSDNTYQ